MITEASFVLRDRHLRRPILNSSFPREKAAGCRGRSLHIRKQQGQCYPPLGEAHRGYGLENAPGSAKPTVTPQKTNVPVLTLGGAKRATINFTDADQALPNAWGFDFRIGT